MPPVRVLVVDDDPDFRFLLKLQLDLVDDLETVGEAGDGFEALEAVERLAPDAMVLDLMMPRMDGFETIVRLRERGDTVHVVAYTAVASPTAEEHCSRHGVPLLRKSGETGPLVAALLNGRAG